MILDISKDELIEHLPIGTFRTDERGAIIDANEKWFDLFGIQSLKDLKDKRVIRFFVDPQECNNIEQRVLAEGKVVGAVYLMKKHGGGRLFAQISVWVDRDETGQYRGLQGTVIDVTDRELTERITGHLPLGFYLVRKEQGKDRIAYCNFAFAQMYEFENQQDAIGYEISRLFKNQIDYQQYIFKLERSDENIIRCNHVKSVGVGGREFTSEATVRCWKDENGKPTERLGVIRDLSMDHTLRVFQQDIGLMLHTYSTNLISIRHTIETVAESFKPNPFGDERIPSHEEVIEALYKPIRMLDRALNRFNNIVQPANAKDETILELQEWHLQLTAASKTRLAMQRLLMLGVARKISNCCDQLYDKKLFPRERIRTIQKHSDDIIRIVNLALLLERDLDIIELDHEVHALRAYTTATLRHDHDNQDDVVDLWEIANQSMRNFQEFAMKRHIVFRPQRKIHDTSVWGNERDLLRCVSNLLHNAIKYTWHKTSQAWIEVKILDYGNNLVLEIENYGVPIPPDELEENRVFEFGFRSRLSSDRGRVGTGIGLTDSKAVVERHGGTICLYSEPAVPTRYDLDDELRPHITTVAISLPRYRKE